MKKKAPVSVCMLSEKKEREGGIFCRRTEGRERRKKGLISLKKTRGEG